MSRPYVLLSAAVSLDGYLDDTDDERLLLSTDEDLDRVDELRAGVDAILVGSNTVRRDNPRLLVRSQARAHRRSAAGLAPGPMKVTVTGRGDLDPAARFFTAGDVPKFVYAASPVATGTRARVGERATVVDAGDPLRLSRVLDDLAARGVSRLMVEGGGMVHTAMLAAGLVDELQLVYAPFLLGTRGGARFLGAAAFPQDNRHPMTLAEVRQIGELVLLRYLIGAGDE